MKHFFMMIRSAIHDIGVAIKLFIEIKQGKWKGDKK